MADMILGIIAVAFVLAMFAVVVVLCFDDTETFRAIDEKIARAIKGDDDEIVAWMPLPEKYKGE